MQVTCYDCRAEGSHSELYKIVPDFRNFVQIGVWFTEVAEVNSDGSINLDFD